MNNIPKELEESQLNLQVVIDPATKCLTMTTTSTGEEIASNIEAIVPDILPNDPLLQPLEIVPDFEKMSELDKLIYSERQRLLNLKKPRKPIVRRRRKLNDKSAYFSDETDSVEEELTQNKKSKIRMRKLRERETSEERELRGFRQRVITLKSRLMQRLRNFEDETFLNEMKKRNTDRIKQKRLETMTKETPEQTAQRKSKVNSKTRLARLQRKAFQTAEDLLADKEKRLKYANKFWSRLTTEEKQALRKATREKAKERNKKNRNEWKKVEMIIKGTAPVEEEFEVT